MHGLIKPIARHARTGNTLLLERNPEILYFTYTTAIYSSSANRSRCLNIPSRLTVSCSPYCLRGRSLDFTERLLVRKNLTSEAELLISTTSSEILPGGIACLVLPAPWVAVVIVSGESLWASGVTIVARTTGID
jgi:hypothetical protein